MSYALSTSPEVVHDEALHPWAGEEMGGVERCRMGNALAPLILSVLAHVNMPDVAKQALQGIARSDDFRARGRRQPGRGQGIVTLHVNRGLRTGDS